MSKPFERVGVVVRAVDPAVSESCEKLAGLLADRGIEALVDQEGPLAPCDGMQAVAPSRLRAHCDLVVAIGGDGTMLRAAALVAGADIPLVGVNRGRLGFLADIGPDTMVEELGRMLDGDFARDERMILRAELACADGRVERVLALNDIVIQKFDVGRMLEVEVHLDGTYVNTHRGDGLIVSTPTGSTAYALSGGGPIMAPGLDAIAMVPICPHTLSDRPVVVSAGGRLTLRVLEKAGSHAQIMADGVLLGDVSGADTLTVSRAEERVTLLHPADYDYFRILRGKLAWGRDRGNT